MGPVRNRPHEVTLKGGDRVLVRPIRSDDGQRMLDAFDRLSPESRYRRFFSPTPSLNAEQLRFFTSVDHHRHEALVAVDPQGGEGLGVARFIRSADDPETAEVAVAVVDEWQGRGLGTELLHELAARAREEGVERFSASVLIGNEPMLELLRELGDAHVTEVGQGVLELVTELPPDGIPVELGHAVRAAARGDLEPDAGSLTRRYGR